MDNNQIIDMEDEVVKTASLLFLVWFHFMGFAN